MPHHPTSWRSISVSLSHLCLCLQCGLLPSGLHTKSLLTLLLLQYLLHAQPIYIFSMWSPKKHWVVKYRVLSYNLNSFIHSPFTSPVLDTNNITNAIFSNTLSLHSYLNIRDHISHTYTTTGKFIVLYILILNENLEAIRFCIEW